MSRWADLRQNFTGDPKGQSRSRAQTGSRSVHKQKFGTRVKLPNFAMHCHAWINKPFAWVFVLMTSAEFPVVEITKLEFPGYKLIFPRSAAIIRHLG